MSKQYEAALEASRAAYTKFDAVRRNYRAQKIGDAEFLAAKREYDAAFADFDAAYAAEQAR